jgi:hypothetical protein
MRNTCLVCICFKTHNIKLHCMYYSPSPSSARNGVSELTTLFFCKDQFLNFTIMRNRNTYGDCIPSLPSCMYYCSNNFNLTPPRPRLHTPHLRLSDKLILLYTTKTLHSHTSAIVGYRFNSTHKAPAKKYTSHTACRWVVPGRGVSGKNHVPDQSNSSSGGSSSSGKGNLFLTQQPPILIYK